jgi:hypothetical protein
MVLEGASGPQSDSYDNGTLTSDSTPSSDMDPYASYAPMSTNSIDFTTLAAPMPFLGPVTGYSRPRFESMVLFGVTKTGERLNRQLTPDETQALAQNYARTFRYSSWGDGLGILAGWAKCYQRADTFKWPIGENLRIKNPDSLGPLRGYSARMGWHALRSVPYALVGWALIGSFGGAYAATVFVVNRGRDPRLKDVDRELNELAQLKTGSPPKKASTPNYEAGTPADFDDMSPQSGVDGALLSDNQMRIEESRQEENARRPKPVDDRITTREERRDWDKSWGAKPNEGGPRAGKPVNDPMYGMSAAEKQAASGMSKESAWDRLRREAAEKANK